ncbi:VIT and VWA domain-containing protein [Teredinibacter sp. KSP-S5-2]|uniref:VIT and vWA domain-containing protein n=1 Tax=Teredinibacter sp. KSP-S5-2 TaxID=3034506 RepID=UPI002934CACB|nr:VIT and VWA domain-containing protein [Teredinibacter sp. KSP-S5-2]WNO08896.1 VIT and VWA domain-containing protein [Teredinibacter sp. KSP-S5-2]
MRGINLFKLLCIAVPIVVSPIVSAAGLMKPANSGLPDLEIREHHVDVVIEDGYATTSVEQVFHNPNNSDLEAIYSFPVPESAAVGEFIYWINDQPVIGEVVEKEKARKIYEQEKAAGRNTALAEKDKYKTFDISVYPVKAQSDVKIRLVYIQPSYVDTGIGRYVYPLEEGGVDEEKIAFWSRNEVVTEKFSFNLRFRSSYPIDALRLPKHPNASIQQLSQDEWAVKLVNSNNQEEGGNTPNVITLSQDIVVYWRHQEGLSASLDLVTYKSDENERGTFMLTLTPGDDLGKITQGSDWVFVLDISGSMQGKYATLVEGVRQGLGKLRPEDRFKVVLFNDHSIDLTAGFLSVSQANVGAVLHQLENYNIGGGTNLYSSLEMGLKGIDADRPAGIVLVTDGVANVGNTEKTVFLKLLQNYDVRLFTFIMGNSANRPLLTEMTEVSSGFAISVSNSDDIVGQIILATSKLTHQAFRDVELDIDGVRVKNLTPEKIGSIYRGEQLTVFGHYWKPGKANIVLKAKVGGQEKTYRTTVDFPEVSQRNPEIERLWAFASIENLQSKLDYFGADKDVEQAITDIAVEYGLVTDYTSMIVVEEEVFQALNIDRNNKRRVEAEQKAREDRKVQPVKSNRADEQQPMFNKPRPSMGGSGAVNPAWVFIIFTMMMLPILRKRFQR